MKPQHINLGKVGLQTRSGLWGDYRDVGRVTPEVGKLESWDSEVACHLERSSVLHHQLDDSLVGGDVRQAVLL